MGIGEILDAAITVYRRHGVLLLKLVTPIVVAIAFLTFLIEVGSTASDAIVQDGTVVVFTDRDLAVYNVGLGVGFLVTLVGTLIAAGAVFRAVADAFVGGEPTWAGSIGYAMRRLHSLLWVSALTWLILIPASLALLIPGIWLYVAFAVAPAVLMAEGVRGRRALGRSFRLVNGRWWHSFGVLMIAFVVAALVQAILAVLPPLVADIESTTALAAWNACVLAVSTILTTPFTVAATTVLYFDLRVRKEGFDLELLARDAGIDLTAPVSNAIARFAEPDVKDVLTPPTAWRPPVPDRSDAPGRRTPMDIDPRTERPAGPMACPRSGA